MKHFLWSVDLLPEHSRLPLPVPSAIISNFVSNVHVRHILPNAGCSDRSGQVTCLASLSIIFNIHPFPPYDTWDTAKW